MNLLLILLVSMLSCAAQLCQKHAALQGTRRGKTWLMRWIALSMALLAIAMLLWLMVLRVTPVSIAYPMLSLNFILVAFAARLIWHETYRFQQWLGVVAIVVGVILMGSSL